MKHTPNPSHSTTSSRESQGESRGSPIFGRQRRNQHGSNPSLVKLTIADAHNPLSFGFRGIEHDSFLEGIHELHRPRKLGASPCLVFEHICTSLLTQCSPRQYARFHSVPAEQNREFSGCTQ